MTVYKWEGKKSRAVEVKGLTAVLLSALNNARGVFRVRQQREWKNVGMEVSYAREKWHPIVSVCILVQWLARRVKK